VVAHAATSSYRSCRHSADVVRRRPRCGQSNCRRDVPAVPHKRFGARRGTLLHTCVGFRRANLEAPCIRPTSLTRKWDRYGLSLRAASL